MQKMAVDRARSGEIGIRPSERRRQVEEAQLAAGGGAYGAPKPDAFGMQSLFCIYCTIIMLTGVCLMMTIICNHFLPRQVLPITRGVSTALIGLKLAFTCSTKHVPHI